MSKTIEAMPAEVKDRFKALKVLHVSMDGCSNIFETIIEERIVLSSRLVAKTIEMQFNTVKW